MNRISRTKALGLLAAALLVLPVTGFQQLAFGEPSFNVVQLNIQTEKALGFQYSLTAYNTSGYQVVAYQSSYPAAAFLLPLGTYLVTASAFFQNLTCFECPLSAGGANSPADIVARPVYYSPYTEYGYAILQVKGPSSASIQTRNASAVALTEMTVHVSYVNGTSAVGASVSGYVVGSYYVYSPKMVTWGQTDKQGSVTLVLPKAPVEASAYLSMSLKLPRNSTVVTVDIGGKKVNVTVSWQPTYLSLSGEALILPPQSGGTVVLQYRPYYPIYYAGALAVAGATGPATSVTTTVSSVLPAAGQQTTQAGSTGRIAPFTPTSDQITTATSDATVAPDLTAGAVAVAAMIFFVVFTLVALWTRKRGNRVSAA